MNTMFEKVVDVLKNYTDVPEKGICPESLLVEDLGLNSVSYFSIVFDLEEALGVEISDDAVSGIRTVGDMVKYLENA